MKKILCERIQNSHEEVTLQGVGVYFFLPRLTELFHGSQINLVAQAVAIGDQLYRFGGRKEIRFCDSISWVSQGTLVVKNSSANAGDTGDMGSIPSLEDPLEEDRATHPSIHAWRILWTEEPGGLQSMGSQRDGHDRSDLAST